MRNLILLGMLFVASFVSSAFADPAPLPSNRHIFINVANDAGIKYDLDGAAYGGPNNTYYIKADAGGLNSEWMAPLAADTTGVATTVTSASPTATGTLYLNDAGGRGFSDDIILLLSVKGPIADNFSVNIKSSGYTWTPATPGVYNPVKPSVSTGLSYQPVAVDEIFTKGDLMYGPHVYKPGPGTLGVWSLPLYPGQIVTDPSTAEYLMFIDLKAGAMRDLTLTDNGSVRVDYTFNNLYGDASFNMYGWTTASNQGEGISWTNPSSTNGYTVSYTGTPVAGVTYSTPGPYKAGSTVTVTAEFSKDVADSPVPMITLTGADSLTANMAKIDARHYSYSYATGPGNGVVNVSFTATDLASSNQLTYDAISGATFALDNTPPTVFSTNPASGATGVATNTAISVVFSEAINPASITTGAFTVDGLAGTVSYDAASRTATFVPSGGSLAYGTSYTANLGSGITDLAGNPLVPTSWTFTTISVLLTVNISGTGGGLVNSTPAGITCSGPTCNASFTPGQMVTLLATPDSTSTFSGWSGDCTGTGSCTVTMDAARTVTAMFTAAPHTMGGGTPYAILQDALDNATGTIMALGMTFVENLVFNRPGATLQLFGGYDAGYTAGNNMTTIRGSLVIRDGALEISNVVVQ